MKARLYSPAKTTLLVFMMLFVFVGCSVNTAVKNESPADLVVTIADDDGDGFPDVWEKTGPPDSQESYDILLDNTTGYNDESSLLIQTNTPMPSETFGAAIRLIRRTSRFEGTRLQLSGYIKTEEVDGWAGMWFRIDGIGNDVLAFDNMEDRAPSGTTDWQYYTLVLDVPSDEPISRIAYGFLLGGSGKAWVDDMRFDIVGEDVPITDRYASFQATAEAEATQTVVTQQMIFDDRYDFSDGSLAYIATETFLTADASDANWEETGVIPDIAVQQAWYEFVTPDDDQVLKVALAQFE